LNISTTVTTAIAATVCW